MAESPTPPHGRLLIMSFAVLSHLKTTQLSCQMWGGSLLGAVMYTQSLYFSPLLLSLSSLYLGSESHNTYQWTRHGHGSCPSPSATWPAQQFIWKFNLLGRTKCANSHMRWPVGGVHWEMATGAGNETKWSIRFQPHAKINIIRLASKKKRNR